MSDVYKKFTAQDYAVIPFNAHKQYNFTTSSYSNNKIEYYNASWTSESVSFYTSASAVYGGDTINVLKYNQLNHLFYKSFKSDNANRFGNFNYLYQKRELNEKVGILSIPTGLYGHEIKPGSLYISASDVIMIDDKKGNLIVSGTNTDHYPTDIRSNIFNIGPSKGFKNLDLDVWKGYAVELKDPHALHGELTKRFWRRGHHNPNAYSTYTTVSGSDMDDSYFFNSLKYYDISFGNSSSLLGRYNNNYSLLNFNSLIGSYITSPHNEKFNFNHDNFSISFYIRPEGHSPITSSIVKPVKPGRPRSTQGTAVSLRTSQTSTTSTTTTTTTTTTPSNLEIGMLYKGGYIFHIEKDINIPGKFCVYIVSPHIYGYSKPETNPYSLVSGWGPIGTTVSNISSSIIGGGKNQTAQMAANEGSNGFLGKHITNNHFGAYNDWWLPNETELEKIVDTFELPLQTEIGTCLFTSDTQNGGVNPIHNLQYPSTGGDQLTVSDINLSVANATFTTSSWGGFDADGGGCGNWDTTLDPGTHHWIGGGVKIPDKVCKPPILKLATSTEVDSNNFLQFELKFVGPESDANINNHTLLTKNNVRKDVQSGFTADICPNYEDSSFLLVRKECVSKNIIDGGKGGDPLRRYIICKSTTKTVIPTAKSGKAQTFNTNLPNNLQPLDTQAEPQFPFEIYMKNNDLFFDRSDGDIISTVSASITSSNTGNPNHLSHILCQLSGSYTGQGSQHMEIYKDGILLNSVKDISIKQNQNTANIYIGSKGKQSSPDSHGQKTNKNQTIPQIYNDFRYYNGALSHINIWDKSFNTASIKNISESVNASPYIGNVFYQHGFTTITHPKYYQLLNTDLTGQGIGKGSIGNGLIVGNNDIGKVQFKGSHLIYENEYQCTVEEHEFNSTMNISARKIKSDTCNELDDFATGSLFKPYVTTIGLYNENNELLVVGKLGQPIRMSNETDTTFIMRWDS